MKNIKITGFAFLIFITAFQSSADTNFRFYRDGRTDFDLTVNYFKTTSNFSDSGSKTDLPAGRYLQTIDTTAQGRYVMFNDLAIFGGLNTGYAESNDSVATRTNSTLTSVFLGSDFQFFKSSSFNLTGEVSYLHALEKVKQDTDSVINSDGASEFTALVGTTFNFDSLYFFAKGGGKYRGEGLSSLLLYTAGLESRFDDLAVGALVNGFSTIKNDDYTNNRAYRDNTTSRVNAFSYKYYAVNPNLLDSEFYFKYHFTKDLEMKVFAGYPILGSNTAVGIHGGASIAWGFGSSGNSVVPHSYNQKDLEPRKVPVIHSAPVPAPKPAPVSPSRNSFKEDTEDGVNQNYFKPVSPSTRELEEPIDEPEIKMKRTGPVAPRVDNPDYKIKLKKIKKKKPNP